MYDLIVIGAGPAGISAGLYAKRAGINVLIIYHGTSDLEKAEKIENYYGFENGIDGKTLYSTGIAQAKNLGIPVLEEEVLSIKKIDEFTVETDKNTYTSKALILATGTKNLRPNIDGITEFEGKGVSYCAICDGFFYRGKDVTVIGNGKYAISEANDLKNLASSVTILTDGKPLEEQTDFKVIDKKIKSIQGENTVSSILFEDGTTIDAKGVFIAIGTAGTSDFAKKMGIILNGSNIVVDENMQTNIDGLYSCGDSTGGLLQVSKAVYEGAKAGLAASKYIKKN